MQRSGDISQPLPLPIPTYVTLRFVSHLPTHLHLPPLFICSFSLFVVSFIFCSYSITFNRKRVSSGHVNVEFEIEKKSIVSDIIIHHTPLQSQISGSGIYPIHIPSIPTLYILFSWTKIRRPVLTKGFLDGNPLPILFSCESPPKKSQESDISPHLSTYTHPTTHV